MFANYFEQYRSSVNVITAGPSAGKSSTIRELSARGHQTLPEAARIVFDQAISEGNDPATLRKRDDYHELIEERDREIESHIGDGVVFLDRSLADNIAYRTYYGNDDRKKINELKQECVEMYDNVFILERIDFVNDEVRVEDEEEAQEIHQLLIDTYEQLGYDPIHIPVMPVDERADKIEQEIRQTPPIH